MKKTFILTMSIMKKGYLKEINYICNGNTSLNFDAKTCFPSIPLIAAYASKDDDINLVVIKIKDDKIDSDANLEKFDEELSALNKKLETNIKINKIIEVPYNENKNTHIELLSKLINVFDGGKLYCDITYGTKPMPIIMITALNYAEKVKDCDVDTIVYGQYSHDGSDKGELFDVTALYHINSVINTAAMFGGQNVEEIVKTLLKI